MKKNNVKLYFIYLVLFTVSKLCHSYDPNQNNEEQAKVLQQNLTNNPNNSNNYEQSIPADVEYHCNQYAKEEITSRCRWLVKNHYQSNFKQCMATQSSQRYQQAFKECIDGYLALNKKQRRGFINNGTNPSVPSYGVTLNVPIP